ncbi:MAG: protein tyrosine phosphatase [Proteobacteria bacterium]|nr:protein tyrosine phosphatase [Pseudomonadota bacterium]
MTAFDLSRPRDRARAYLEFIVRDHAFLRLGFRNAHWISSEMARSNQPWPHQLRHWKARGVKTVINLRGGFDAAFYALEEDACRRLGLVMVNFTLTSRDAPSAAQVRSARDLFASIEYPALLHCKSGADRASLMSALYVHLRLRLPAPEAMRQLSWRYLHLKGGRTGILDYVFERYLTEGASAGLDFLQWVERPDYDPARIKADFEARRRPRARGLSEWLGRE